MRDRELGTNLVREKASLGERCAEIGNRKSFMVLYPT
jgi:hypothetical protein